MTDQEKENSRQLEQFIIERDCILESQELLYAININLHPQINHIVYYACNNEYKMWDKEGKYFNFYALNYKETREEYFKKRNLIKK